MQPTRCFDATACVSLAAAAAAALGDCCTLSWVEHQPARLVRLPLMWRSASRLLLLLMLLLLRR